MEGNLIIWVFAAAVLLLIVGLLFRGKIKAQFKFLGGAMSIEGENPSSGDKQTESPPSTVDDRSVGVGGSADKATIVTGDNNKVG